MSPGRTRSGAWGDANSARRDRSACQYSRLAPRASNRPVLRSAGDNWLLDKRQLSTVRVVAALRDDVADVDNTRVLLHLFDGSGAVQLTYFPDPDDTVWAHTRGSIA